MLNPRPSTIKEAENGFGMNQPWQLVGSHWWGCNRCRAALVGLQQVPAVVPAVAPAVVVVQGCHYPEEDL